MESKFFQCHAICFPSPFQSHIKAMLKLAKLIHHKGFHITFVNAQSIHKRFLNSTGKNDNNSMNCFPNFHFETIPDGLPTSDDGDAISLCENIRNHVMLQPFLDLVAKLNERSSKSSSVVCNINPPVSCIISDGFMSSTTIRAAGELEIPVVMFFTISACSLMGFKQFRTLIEKGITPVKDKSCLTTEYLDKVLDWIPGMKDIRIRDLPTFARTDNPNDLMFHLTMEAVENASKASAILIHTFDSLEQLVLDALSSMFPNLFSIAPLHLLLNQIQEQHGVLNSIEYNLWKEETDCLKWLDSKEPNSVIYVNFGSLVVMTKEQLIEVEMGLRNSNHPFLWIIRPDLVTGQTKDILQINKDKRKGFISGWCLQEEVLKHPSIGGFLTHCGWNSTIESLSAGVPMICWAFEGDQTTNCRFICKEWGVGMELINGEEEEVIKRNEVEKLVRELMEGEKGKKLRHKAGEWKRLAEEAAANSDGSSWSNLDKLVNQILLPNKI